MQGKEEDEEEKEEYPFAFKITNHARRQARTWSSLSLSPSIEEVRESVSLL